MHAKVEIAWSKPNKDLAGKPVYISHERDLMTALLDVPLIDAYGVYPEVAGLALQSEVPQSLKTVNCDEKRFIIAEYPLVSVTRTPYV